MRGFIKERTPGNFTAFWEDKHPATGKRRQHSKAGFKTKGAAPKHLNSIIGAVQDGTWRPDKPLTVAELLNQHWLPAQRARELRPATLAQYKGVIDHWLCPRLGGLRVNALTPAIVVDFISASRSETTAKGRTGLSPRSVSLATGILKAAVEWAQQNELIGRNPIASVRRPRPETKVMSIWTDAQAKAFLKATREDRLHFLWALALTRGLRRGELVGLKWQAVDLDAGVLRVESTWITVDGKALASRPKTQAGLRSISLDPALVALLRSHRARQLREKLAAGSAYEDSGYLVADELGKVYHPASISGWFEAATAKAGLPRVRLHDCRHAAASFMLGAGEPVKTVSEVLGHASVTVTLQTYAHSIPGSHEKAGARLSASLLG